MSREEVTIKLTKHAKGKIAQRGIYLDDVRKAVLTPELTKTDKFDDSLIHFIRKVRGRFLRVIGRWESEDVFLVISAFYDRRLKGREKK